MGLSGLEKLTLKDLSALLSVRRRIVERALVWLKRNNPLYANTPIDTAEMERWGEPLLSGAWTLGAERAFGKGRDTNGAHRSSVRERDFIGNTVPEKMTAAEKRLEKLRDATVADAESWNW